MNQKHHVFLSEDLTQGPHDRDEEEVDLEVFRVPVPEQMILDGRIVDNCTVSAWGIYRLWRERQR